jgi:plastocyanin
MGVLRPDLLQVINKPIDLSHLVPYGLLCAYDFKIKGNGVIQDISQKTLNGGNPGTIYGDVIQTIQGIGFGYTTEVVDLVESVLPKQGYISLQNAITGVKTICMSVKVPMSINKTPLFGDTTTTIPSLSIDGYGLYFANNPFSKGFINGDPYLGQSIPMSVLGNESWLSLVFTGPSSFDYSEPTIGRIFEDVLKYGVIEIRDLRIFSEEFSDEDTRNYSNELNGINLLEDFSSNAIPEGAVIPDGGFELLSDGYYTKKKFNYLASTVAGENTIALKSAQNYGYFSVLIKKPAGNFVQWMPIAIGPFHPSDSRMSGIKVTYQANGYVGIFNIRNGEGIGYENPIAITDDEWHLFELNCTAYGDMMLTVDGVLSAAISQSNGINPTSNELVASYSIFNTDNISTGFANVTSTDSTNKSYPQLYDVVYALVATQNTADHVRLEVSFLTTNSPRTYERIIYERSDDGINFTRIGESLNAIFNDTTVLPETNYWYRAFAETSNQASESFTINVLTPAIQFPMILKLVITAPNTTVNWTNSSSQGFNYNYTVDFDDGSQAGPYQWYGTYSHVYATPGTYYFTLTGTCTHFGPANTSFRNALREVVSWGKIGSKVLNFSNSRLAIVPADIHNGFSTLTQLPGFGNTKLVSVPAGIFDNAVNITAAYGVFQGCQLLTTVPADLLKNSVNVTQISSMFANCPSLTAVPVRMIDNCPNIYNFYGVFFNCVNLTGLAPEWWNIYTAPNVVGYDCFLPDVNLTNYLDIPDPWGGVQIPLEAPINLSVTDITGTTATASWTNIETGLGQSAIQASFDGIQWMGEIGYAFGDDQTAPLNLNPETHYWCRVVNQKGTKTSPPSNVVDFTTPAPEPPDAPINFIIGFDPAHESGSVIKATWESGGAQNGYILDVSNDGVNWTNVDRWHNPPFYWNTTEYSLYVGQEFGGDGYNEVGYIRVKSYNNYAESAYVSGSQETKSAPFYAAPSVNPLNADAAIVPNEPSSDYHLTWDIVVDRSATETGTYVEVLTRPAGAGPTNMLDVNPGLGTWWYRTRYRIAGGLDGLISPPASVTII